MNLGVALQHLLLKISLINAHIEKIPPCSEVNLLLRIGNIHFHPKSDFFENFYIVFLKVFDAFIALQDIWQLASFVLYFSALLLPDPFEEFRVLLGVYDQ